MNYDEVAAIIEQFRNQNPFVVNAESVHGLVVTRKEDQFVLELLVSKMSERPREDERMPRRFTYKFEEAFKDIQCEVVVKPVANSSLTEESFSKTLTVPVRAGDSARGLGSIGVGTAGWNVYLNGVLVTVSNWHVLCPHGNETPIGNRVVINNSDVASLYTFQKIYPSAENTWDYALAKFDNPADVVGSMRVCQSGSSYPYPQMLSVKVGIGDGVKYYKVGNRSPICREGTLDSIGDRIVDYGNGVRAAFRMQLIFSKMTDPGDSGCMIVRESDNTVTGLNFAGNPLETVANPFFKIGWTYKGELKVPGGESFPVFSDGYSANGFHFGHDPIPDLSAGKVFLGVRTALCNSTTGAVYQWITPGFPPIRPKVDVLYVPACPTPDQNSDLYYHQGHGQPPPGLRSWDFFAFG